MTPDELKKIANMPGFGTGAIVRDELHQNATILERLPKPEKIAKVQARSGDGGYLCLIADFGNSLDDGNDWQLYHRGADDLSGALGHDAKQDAQTIADIVNAYRAGILILNPELDQ